jgi:hypothetical protein
LKAKFRLPAETTPASKALAALKAWQAQQEPTPEAVRRLTCSLFDFWRFCADKRCRRALMCSGDPFACFQIFWPHVPEEEKVRFRALLTAKKAGGGARELAAAADEAVARWRELEKRFGEPQAAPAHVANTGTSE